MTEPSPSRQTLWEGRLRSPMSARTRSYTSSIDVDLRLLPDDVEGSLAHADMLRQMGLIDQASHAAITAGLEAVREEFNAGNFSTAESDEDVHSAVERRLHELVGEAALRLHAGRSRNDQVATDLRLFARRSTRDLIDGVEQLRAVLDRRATEHTATVMPGYTHLQRAQPVTLALHLQAYREMFGRDRDRLNDSLARADVLPLGSGALAGSTLPLDATATAARLGFSAVSGNSMDAVSDRDFAAEIAMACALLMVHCSRLGDDIVLWCSAEFGFMRLDDAHATGSSLMPHKKNPDVAELARGRSARVIGDVVTLLTMLKGLPLTYARDLQEDKRPLYDAIDTARETVLALAELLDAATFDSERMRRAASDSALLATDVAELLVRRGVPFRTAHRTVAEMVRRAEDGGRTLAGVSAEEWEAVAPGSGADIVALFDLDSAVRRRFG